MLGADIIRLPIAGERLGKAAQPDLARNGVGNESRCHGGTLAGIATGLSPEQRALGVAVLKGGQFLASKVAELQRQEHGGVLANWSIEYGFHFGGFAKSTPELRDFIDDFEWRHGLRLYWIYAGKNDVRCLCAG